MSDLYNMIVAALRKASLQSVEAALDRAVTEEKEALQKYFEPRLKKRERRGQTAMRAAMEYYGQDILRILWRDADLPLDVAPPGLTPDEILSHRRAPTAWAIACKMRDAGITPETLHGAQLRFVAKNGLNGWAVWDKEHKAYAIDGLASRALARNEARRLNSAAIGDTP